LFFCEGFGDSEVISAGPAAPVGDLIAPLESLTIAFRQCREGAPCPERIAHIADGPFHPAFLIARADLAGPRREVLTTGIAARSNLSRISLAMLLRLWSPLNSSRRG
jgi:hypothetical protein